AGEPGRKWMVTCCELALAQVDGDAVPHMSVDIGAIAGSVGSVASSEPSTAAGAPPGAGPTASISPPPSSLVGSRQPSRQAARRAGEEGRAVRRRDRIMAGSFSGPVRACRLVRPGEQNLKAWSAPETIALANAVGDPRRRRRRDRAGQR